MPEIKHKKSNLAFPADEPMSSKELAKAIKEAEKGPFHSSEQVKQAIKKWSKKYSR